MGLAGTTGSSPFSVSFEPYLRQGDAARLARRDLEGLQETLGYRFKDGGLLEEALCHSSFAHEHGLSLSNERLEFLGDSVLSFLVARILFERHPDATEGELSQIRSALVCGASLWVPLLRYAKCGFSAGTARMADAVSCPATVTTGTFPIPVSLASASVSVPIVVPGSTSGWSNEGERPIAVSSDGSKRRVAGFSSCDVDASVYSQTCFPVSM